MNGMNGMNGEPRSVFLGDMFGDFMNMPTNRSGGVDIYEESDNYVMEMDLPGYTKEEIKVDYNNGYVIVSARKAQEQNVNKGYIRRERYFGEFRKSYYVGTVDETKINVNYENGILRLAFPRNSIESGSVRNLEIK